MSAYFEELDYQMTALGPLSLRRRRQFKLNIDVVEVILGDGHLMSDLFTASEEALANLAIAELSAASPDILVAGLGLGYTAATALDHDKVAALTVIEFLPPVIGWHQQGLLPLGQRLVQDPRCRLVEADFFHQVAVGDGIDPTAPEQRYDAILVDIDHSPEFHLNPRHEDFYSPEGLTKLAAHLRPGGIFALWSNDRPDQHFVDQLQTVFGRGWAEEVVFENPILEEDCIQTVYLGRK
jgi:spermidine synthase